MIHWGQQLMVFPGRVGVRTPLTPHNIRPCSQKSRFRHLEVLDNLWTDVMQRYTGMLLFSKSFTVYIPYKGSVCSGSPRYDRQNTQGANQTDRKGCTETRELGLYIFYVITNVTNAVTANTTENQHPQTLTPDKNINIGRLNPELWLSLSIYSCT